MIYTPSPNDEFGRLLGVLLDGELSPAEAGQLSRLLAEDAQKRSYYVRVMELHARLLARCAPPVLPPDLKLDTAIAPDLLEDLPSTALDHVPSSPLPPPLVIESVRDVLDLMLRPLPFTLTVLVVALLPLLGLLIVRSIPENVPAPVAEIAQLHDTVWAGQIGELPVGTKLRPGQRLELGKGLAKIVFSDGATVLLDGPATFDATSAAEGYLRKGRLVAKVPKGSEGFTVETPSATVVDLGTEFGVSVEPEKGTSEVEVFQGRVELQTGNQRAPDCRRVEAGEAFRVSPGATGGQFVVRQYVAAADTFVRRMPAAGPAAPPATKPTPAIVAEFSGGNGQSQVDQFPGVPGDGWATAWGVGDAKELTCTASIEKDCPLLGGGDHLDVQVERRPAGTKAAVWTAVDRCLAVRGPVDLAKPYVVSFNLRIDRLSRFNEPGDRLSICARNVPQSEFSPERGRSSSGWHICMAGKGGKDTRRATSGNWTFFHRNDEEKAVGVDSGILPREGSIYSFRILVDPQARTWTPSIAVDGGKWTQFDRMGMRSRGTAEKNKYWPFIHFFCQLEGGSAGADVEKIGFSVDSIRITAQ